MFICCLLLIPPAVQGSFIEYIWPTHEHENTAVGSYPAVPYEISESDESFIREASKWIGTNLSKLDLCHHRVILKLKKSCEHLNAEQIGKLAVMLLNCQSDSEGRKVYHCTEQMSLKDCTKEMDPDTWNAYHLVTNRAKAVCASVRHDQFRGLTELTVNKLMNTAHEQIEMMGQLAENQKELHSVTQEAIDEMSANNDRIISQQGDIMRLSEAHRAKVESNFRDLVREKALIRSGQQEVAVMLSDLRSRIDGSIKQLETQSKRSKLNHASLLSDMENLQKSAAIIAGKIDETSEHFASHHQAAEEQYKYTLRQLEKINNTVANMLDMVGALQKNFDLKMAWLTEKIGGSDYILQKMNTIVVHFCYLIFGMICLSFVGADKFIRIFFILVVPGNLLGNLLDLFDSDVIRLSFALGSFMVADLICRLGLKAYPRWRSRQQTLSASRDQTDQPEQRQQESSVAPRSRLNVPFVQTEPTVEEDDEETESQDAVSYLNSIRSRFSRERSVTPSVANGVQSRRSVTREGSSGEDRQQCTARTVRGEQCRALALAGRHLCRVHDQRGL